MLDGRMRIRLADDREARRRRRKRNVPAAVGASSAAAAPLAIGSRRREHASGGSGPMRAQGHRLRSAAQAAPSLPRETDGSLRRGGAACASYLEEGRETFRFDTFGSEDFWGGRLKLHQAIAGEANGGVGPGHQPAAGARARPEGRHRRDPRGRGRGARPGRGRSRRPGEHAGAAEGQRRGRRDRLLRRGRRRLTSVGIQCALCHSTVDDAYAPGIGHRLDGWPNRDLDVGAIVAAAPDLTRLRRDAARSPRPTVKKAAAGWGPGKFDAELNLDGKAFRPDGKTAATLHPAGVRAGRRQQPHLDRGLGHGQLLERLCRQSRDARQGRVLRSAARRRREVSGRRPDRTGPQAGRGGPDHREAAGAPVLSALAADPEAARGRVRQRRGGERARRSSTTRPDARPATSRRSSPSRAGTCTPPRRSASTISRRCDRPDERYRTDTAARAVGHGEDPQGRLLSRRPVRHARRRRRALRHPPRPRV